MTPAHVLVVEDDADFRWLLTALLHADPDVCVTGEAGDGEAAVALVLLLFVREGRGLDPGPRCT